ncbi:thermonuclease family protein [Rhizobium mesoamericanum]|uniref:thermonuclease family protein n=1 Tax=Rhizobium mesoamericanum TaxID=1079800 RepID=UPI00048CF19E|nr:thermonuclease family protein [Rhizobium mesoamericanum]
METTSNLKRDIEVALRRPDLNAWQRKFLTDVLARIDRRGDSFALSDKQWRKVFEVLGHRSNVVQFQPRASSSGHHRLASYRRPRFVRRGAYRLSWSEKRFLAAAVVLAAISCIQFVTGSKFDAASVVPSPAGNGFASSKFTVTDGDTIHVAGEIDGTRLVGYNAPEVFSPRCASEKDLGDRATARLQELVAAGPVKLTRVPCACKPGTEGTDRCNYGRSCAVLYAGGHDVSSIMISEGLAVPFVCGGTRCPPTPRPWCG